MMLYLALLGALFGAARGVVRLTGDAEADFTDMTRDEFGDPRSRYVVKIVDGFAPQGQVPTTALPDVGVPNQLPASTISGWDINSVYWQYDYRRDELIIGIDCFGICGDADGDGDEGEASADLQALGGQDLPDLARGEGIAIAVDFDLNVADVLPDFRPDILVPFDFIIGVPAGQPADAVANPMPGQVGRLPCTNGRRGNDLLNMRNCLGIYDYQLTNAVNMARRVEKPTINATSGQPWPIRDALRNTPNKGAGDIEWVISDVTALRELRGATFFINNLEPWALLMQAFSGSFLDAGVGEDYLPSQTDYREVRFPCLIRDECDECQGRGNTCLDCAGVPNGPAVYDCCDVCDGDGTTCLDCAGECNGPATYDICDVCDGNGDTCDDCAGVPNGPATYDCCDVCEGDGTTCLDCAGICNGPTEYDCCDVCGGDGSTCLDCAGECNGAATYDCCDVCGGNGDTCLDCAGICNGPTEYDGCDICGGDNSDCGDCLGVPNGGAEYDCCDICDGDGTTCLDCAGTCNGPLEYDVCDLCGGDGTTCVDCANVPFGTCKYDNCGVCCGDGSSCVCLKIHECPTVEVDHALLEWSLVATIDRIDHTVDVLEGIKEELCKYDVNRGNLASDIAGYLSTANDFRDVLDNFCYVSLWFKDTVEEAIELI